MYSNSIQEFEGILEQCLLFIGLDETIKDILIPFLEKVNILSYDESSIEVHFVVTAVRRKIILGIERANSSPLKNQTALLFLPKGEHYDLILLYLNYILKSSGFNVLYLGTNISKENLIAVLKSKQPDLVYTYLTKKHLSKAEEYADCLRSYAPPTKLFIAQPTQEDEEMLTEKNIVYFFFKHLRKTFLYFEKR
jgi:hypothetical protein